MCARILAATVFVFAVGALSRADDKPIDRAEVDKRVVTTVYQTALRGTEIFNKGKHEECFGQYHGALSALLPMLDHRPALADSVKAKLAKAESMKAAEGAFVLRLALDEIQNEIAPGKKALWDRLGGEKTVRAIVRDLINLAIENKKVNLLRDGKYKLDAKGVANLEQLLVEVVSAASKGPLPYTGTRDMKKVHEGMKITDEEFDALGADMIKALEKNKVGKPEIEELMAEIEKTRAVIVEVKKKGM